MLLNDYKIIDLRHSVIEGFDPDELILKISALKKEITPYSAVGKLSDEQVKYVAKLKKDLESTEKEFATLKTKRKTALRAMKKSGKIKFVKKVEIDIDGSTVGRPEYVFKWGVVANPNSLHHENTCDVWERSLGAEYVGLDDNYWPEGAVLNGDGHYKVPNGDAILMKIGYAQYIEKRTSDIADSENAAKANIRNFDTLLPPDARLTEAEKNRR